MYNNEIFIFDRFITRCLLIDDVNLRRHYFLCNDWLADNIGDGLLERTYEEATVDELHAKDHLFFNYTNKYELSLLLYF